MAERYAILTREIPPQPDATIGRLKADIGNEWATCELPWRNNDIDLSCVPVGAYQVIWKWSQRHGCNLYQLQGVPGRTAVEIHAANIPQQLLGCIAPGVAPGEFTQNSISEGVPAQNQRGVIQSQIALAQFEAAFIDPNTKQQLPFTLTIQ